MPWPNHLRAELARCELEKSSIITSIAAPGTSSLCIQQAIDRYVELDKQARSLLTRLQQLEVQPVALPARDAIGRPRANHRRNTDGSYDSICPICFITIATAQRARDLEEPERAHTCDTGALRRYYEQPVQSPNRASCLKEEEKR
jgi:hypothetical protein